MACPVYEYVQPVRYSKSKLFGHTHKKCTNPVDWSKEQDGSNAKQSMNCELKNKSISSLNDRTGQNIPLILNTTF